MKKRTILLTNDDGFHAAGIMALYQAFKDDYRVLVVAPESEQSGFSHKITLKNPLHLTHFKNNTVEGVIVNGTPADCVKLALLNLYKGEIDLIISGINSGSNNGISTHYSGTVAAVMEGAFYQIPGIAVSLYDYQDAKFDSAANFVKEFVDLEWSKVVSRKSLLNINIPPQVNYREKPIFCPMGLAVFSEGYTGFNHRGKDFYWVGGPDKEIDKHGNDDDRYILEEKITITPLQFDLTNFQELKLWQDENR